MFVTSRADIHRDRCGMTRYFLDITSQAHTIYDYKGDQFLNDRGACQYAETIALDLKYSREGKWTDWSVEVRTAEGQRLCAIPVGTADRLAA
jgi:hypothetical protein